MRTTHIVCLYLFIGLFWFGMPVIMSGQSTFTFTYGENEEFEGSLTASLIMIGQKKDSGKRTSRVLRSSNYSIDYDQYEELSLVLRINSFILAREEHYKNCWLEIPLKEYISKDLPGLVLASKTKVLMLGSEDIPRTRKMGDIRYSIDPTLDRQVEGKLRFFFDFISSRYPWKKIEFKPTFKYAIRSNLPLDLSENKKEIKEEQEKVTEPLIPAPGKEEKEAEEPASIPESEPKGPDTEEAALFDAIDGSRKKAKILQLCEKYRSLFPDGFYLEEVLYRQIQAVSEPAIRSEYLEDYVELFPDGKYLREVNELIFSDFTKAEEETARANPKEIVELPGQSLQAVIKMKDGILSVSDIYGGQPPFRLEFYDAEEVNEKKYAIDIGKNRSFKINLKSLPLEKNTYVIGLVDGKGTPGYYSQPLNVTNSNRFFKVEVPFLSMVLGISILVISAFLLILSRFFSKKRRRKRRRYPSNSYR